MTSVESHKIWDLAFDDDHVDDLVVENSLEATLAAFAAVGGGAAAQDDPAAFRPALHGGAHLLNKAQPKLLVELTTETDNRDLRVNLLDAWSRKIDGIGRLSIVGGGGGGGGGGSGGGGGAAGGDCAQQQHPQQHNALRGLLGDGGRLLSVEQHAGRHAQLNVIAAVCAVRTSAEANALAGGGGGGAVGGGGPGAEHVPAGGGLRRLYPGERVRVRQRLQGPGQQGQGLQRLQFVHHDAVIVREVAPWEVEGGGGDHGEGGGGDAGEGGDDGGARYEVRVVGGGGDAFKREEGETHRSLVPGRAQGRGRVGFAHLACGAAGGMEMFVDLLRSHKAVPDTVEGVARRVSSSLMVAAGV